MSGTGILTAQLSQPSHGCASRRCDHRRFPGRIIGAWLYAGQRDARTSGPPVERLAAGPPARTTACHRPRVHSTGAAHEDSPRPPAIPEVTPVSMLRQRSVLARRHDMRLILRLSLQMLFGALLLERLARLLGKMLSGRFVGHGYSLRGSPPGSLAPPYAGRAVLVITEHPQTETFAHPPHIGDSVLWAVERRHCPSRPAGSCLASVLDFQSVG